MSRLKPWTKLRGLKEITFGRFNRCGTLYVSYSDSGTNVWKGQKLITIEQAIRISRNQALRDEDLTAFRKPQHHHFHRISDDSWHTVLTHRDVLIQEKEHAHLPHTAHSLAMTLINWFMWIDMLTLPIFFSRFVGPVFTDVFETVHPIIVRMGFDLK